jgi:hypothetical protein
MTLTRKTPLRAMKPLANVSKKRQALLDAAGIRSTSTLAPASLVRKPTMRTAATKSTRTAGDPTPETVALVLERDADSCVRCGCGVHGVRGVDWSIHHRRLRSQGGGHDAPNLITLCGNGVAGCHGFAHAHPRKARIEGGWILRRADDPAGYPVAHARLGLVFLTADGGWAARIPGEVAA